MISDLVAAQQEREKEQSISIKNTIDQWRQEVSRKDPYFTAKLRKKLNSNSDSRHLKKQSDQQANIRQTPIDKIEALISEIKSARTPAEKTQAEAHLKKYAQELYKQDPTLKSIRDHDKELTAKIRAILFEKNRSKQIDRTYER